MGAINYPMSDIYGGFAGTTEQTIPEAEDQNALVDDQKATDTTHTTTANKNKIYLAIALILIIVAVIGGRF